MATALDKSKLDATQQATLVALTAMGKSEAEALAIITRQRPAAPPVRLMSEIPTSEITALRDDCRRVLAEVRAGGVPRPLTDPRPLARKLTVKDLNQGQRAKFDMLRAYGKDEKTALARAMGNPR